MAATTDFELSVSSKVGVGSQGVGPSLIDTLHQNFTFAIILLSAGLIVLAIAIAIIIKRRRSVNFSGFAKNSHKGIHFLVLATLLTLGGIVDMTYLNNANAATGDLPFTTSGKVNAEVKEKGEKTTLWCGTDNVTINRASEDGYTIFMKVGNKGKLLSKDDKNKDVESTDDWGDLPEGAWGFIIEDDRTEYSPILLGEGSILFRKTGATGAGEKLQVSFCVNLSSETEEGSRYGAQIEYNIDFDVDLIRDTLGNVVDYLSTQDFDGDGLANRVENRWGTKIDDKDTDGDRLSDAEEVNSQYKEDESGHSNPLSADTDGDGLSDFSEKAAGLKPNKQVSNESGVLDSEYETNYHYFICTDGTIALFSLSECVGNEEGNTEEPNGTAAKTVPMSIFGSGNIADAIADAIDRANGAMDDIEYDQEQVDETWGLIGEKCKLALSETVKITNIAIDYTSTALAAMGEEEIAQNLSAITVTSAGVSRLEPVIDAATKTASIAVGVAYHAGQLCLKALQLFAH
jgi:hypothetical protein